MSNLRKIIDTVRTLSSPVVVVGSANVDMTVVVERIPKAGKTVQGGPLALLPGGKSLNQATASALLGAPTAFIGAVGNDDNGNFLLNAMQLAGVNTTHTARVGTPTSCALIAVNAKGEPAIVVSQGANQRMDVDALETARSAIEQANVLGLALEIPMETVIRAARIAKAADTITVLNGAPRTGTLPPELLTNIDVLIVDESEIEKIVGPVDGDWVETQKRLRKLGVTKVVITLGPVGALVLHDQIEPVAPADVEIVDTTGCGDAFTGGMLAALGAGASLIDAARFGAIVAAYSATGRGASASYGTLEEIERQLFRADQLLRESYAAGQ
mgnify:FL=1